MYRKNISTLSNLCNVTRQFSYLYSPVVLYRFLFLCKKTTIFCRMNKIWLCMYSSISSILSVVRDCDPLGARDLGHAFRQDLGAGEGSVVRIALRVKNIFLENSTFVTRFFPVFTIWFSSIPFRSHSPWAKNSGERMVAWKKDPKIFFLNLVLLNNQLTSVTLAFPPQFSSSSSFSLEVWR